LARFTLVVAAVEALLLIFRAVERVFRPQAAGPALWIMLAGIVLGVSLLALALRWFRRTVMWRLRNRLIVTYVFIAVIPVVLLLAMATIAGYIFAGQFATFIVSSDLHAQLRSLESANRAAARSVAVRVKAGLPLDQAVQDSRLDTSKRSITAWAASGEVFVSPLGSTGVMLPPPGSPESSAAVVRDEQGVYLRAWTTIPEEGAGLTFVATEPLDHYFLERIASDLGEVIFNPPNFQPPKPTEINPAEASPSPAGSGQSSAGEPRRAGGDRRPARDTTSFISAVSDLEALDKNHELFANLDLLGDLSPEESSAPEHQAANAPGRMLASLPELHAGTLAPPRGGWDRKVSFGTFLPVMDWYTGESKTTLLGVHTRLSVLYGRLFATLGERASAVFTALAVIAFFFAILELAALITGVRLTRTMTRSVAALYEATQHVNRGDLSHRIQVFSNDQLATLETSFNSMTESLQKLIVEQKEKQRMEGELAIAREVQAQLFPREDVSLNSLEIHGICLPARTVSGDYYDFLRLGDDKLGIAVGDISGKGISAALLMATIHSAVRVYEFGHEEARNGDPVTGKPAGALTQAQVRSPAAVLHLLNHHLYDSTAQEKYATMFLGFWDGDARRLTYSNAGHLPPLILGADGSCRKLEAGGTVVGLFNDMEWQEESVELRPGDLIVAYSDGVSEPENEFGEFGEQRLLDLVQQNRRLPIAGIASEILSAVQDWIGGNEQPDDITIVLARAR
jgi:sigma-B regulation protein RsbU (phosphoserine phosphatase)